MAFARRRILFVAALAFVFMLLGANGSLQAPSGAQAAPGDPPVGPNQVDFQAGFVNSSLQPDVLQPGDPNFTKSANPPRLYAGDTSHSSLVGTPLPGGGLRIVNNSNGYCVYVQGSDIRPVPGASLGFVPKGVGPVGTTQVAPSLTSGTTAVSPASPANGDYYCAVVTAPRGYTALNLSWEYTTGSDSTVRRVTLNGDFPDTLIPVRTVTLDLKSTSGGAAHVCTVGWDSTFLAGASQPNDPDSIGRVAATDFVASNTTDFDPASLEESQDGEVCVSIPLKSGVVIGTTATTNITFNFRAFYNYSNVTGEYRLEPSVGAKSATISNVKVKATYELQHLSPSGVLLGQQVSPPLVIGSTETVCIARTSSPADTLDPGNISITPVTGAPDIPNVSGLHVFYLNGTGPLCFSYTSSAPGEQAIGVNFSHAGTLTNATWDSDGDGNGTGANGGLLVTQWNRIDSTRIATSTDESAPAITFTTITVPLQFNVADGTFLSSDISLVELVTGSHQANGTKVSGLLQGAVLKASITGGCGYFVIPTGGILGPTEVTGTSVGGRFALDASFLNPGDTPGTPTDLHVSILNDPGCTAGSTLRVTIDVFYPGQTTPALAAEYVDVAFSYFPPAKNPTVAWAGQVVPITYSFNSDTSCATDTVRFTRPTNQRGAFLAGSGITLNGSGEASGNFGDQCTITVNYVSADPGEVDIEVSVAGNAYSKIGFPIFYLALEDITLSATPSSVVSTLGDVTANVRGYFVGTNPSGRQAETKPDGRFVPADRWVLPDDWSQLSGGRSNWGSGTIPPLKVTFGMEKENVVNGYKSGVKDGGVGWFIPASGSTAAPEIGRVPDITGTVPKPRTLTVMTNTSGQATAHTFGDLNLSYEGCAANAPTGNPLCKGLDVVGHTVYTAVADYPEDAGKFPPIAAETSTTEWTWDGYKSVSIVNTDSPQIKYVVAHLRDRDGYCDAAAFNNELGVAVRFDIDSGDGVIIDAQGQPATISMNRRSAIVTSFDTIDDLGNAVHADIAQTAIQDDECQAWIKISNSLLEPANVIVTFPAPPAPVPSELLITALSCDPAAEFVTIKNEGASPASLEGFALRSLPSNVLSQEEHLGLAGQIAPGQSLSFAGGPNAASAGWVETGGTVFGQAGDYARLVWNGFELSRANCDGTFSTPPLPDPLPSSGEGQIIIDTVIPFGLETQTVLSQGWNLLGASSQATDLATAFSGHEDDVIAVYGWDFETGIWERYFASEPAFLNTMDTFEAGHVYWIQVKRQFTLTLLK